MGKKREYRATSKAGEAFIKPHKASHKQRIAEAMAIARVGTTHEEAATLAGMRPDQVWKRYSEMEREGTIFNTGITRKLKSGLMGTVWQLTTLPEQNPVKTDKQQQSAKTIQQLSLYTQ